MSEHESNTKTLTAVPEWDGPDADPDLATAEYLDPSLVDV